MGAALLPLRGFQEDALEKLKYDLTISKTCLLHGLNDPIGDNQSRSFRKRSKIKDIVNFKMQIAGIKIAAISGILGWFNL